MPTMGPSSSELSSQESVNGDVKSASHHSQGPVPGKGPLHHEQSTRDALQYSADASRHLNEKDYNQALTCYQQALYLYQSQETTVGQCNAAATLHNMALLHKKCRRYDASVKCFQEAEDLYRECASHVNSVYVSEPKEGQVCLDHLLIETLQNRAFVHQKYQQDVSRAIACHELVVESILSMEDEEEEESIQEREPPATTDDVVYVKMNNNDRVVLLVESLKSLGMFYNSKGETEGALGALEEALEVLKCQVAEHPQDTNAKKSMATVLINLASVFFGQDEFEQALEALQSAMDLWMEVEEDPARTDVLATVNNMGLAHERMGNLDKALECYEDLLHVRSQVLGSDHVQVADSLTTVAKVLERQGNAEGALDLYQEALRIYKQAATVDDPSLWAQAAHVLGRIGAILLEMGQVDESIEMFNEALQMEHHTLGETSEETASIYHGLGRARMAKGEYDEARECLLKAARMLEAVPNEGVDLESLVKSSEMLTQALNNESFLSSDGTWVNAEIDIQKTPERLALASSMSPIGESSLSGDPGTEDESPSDNFSSSSMSSRPVPSQLPELQVYVHPTASDVNSSIEIEFSPLTTIRKENVPSSQQGSQGDADQDFDPYSSPTSRDSASGPSGVGKVPIDARQASVMTTVDSKSPLRSPSSSREQEDVLRTSPTDETGPAQLNLNLSGENEALQPSWAAALALATEATSASRGADRAPSHIVEETDQVNVSALASPASAMAGPLVARDTYDTVDELGTDSGDDNDTEEEEELHRRLMMEFSEFESASEMGTVHTADYTRSSYGETDEYTNDEYTDDYTNDESDLDTLDYDGATSDLYPNTSDLDTASRQLSSVAEVELSRSYIFTSDDAESRTRTVETSIAESTRAESELFVSELETDDADTDGGHLATTYDDTNSESHESDPEDETRTDYSSELKSESAYYTTEREADDENDYRQLSADSEESDVFGTDLDDTDLDSDLDTEYESATVEDSRKDISPHDNNERPEPYYGAPATSRREASQRMAQLDVGRIDAMTGAVTDQRLPPPPPPQNNLRIEERTRTEQEPINAEKDRPHVETNHEWLENEIQREESTDNDPVRPLLGSSGAVDGISQSPRETRMSSPRVMLVKAFRHSFRRRKSNSKSRLDSMPEDKEHHDASPMVMSGHALPTQDNSKGSGRSFDSNATPLGPIQFVDLRASSFDDNVSQITFHHDEVTVRRRDSSGGSWWWGASSEGLEGWFPAVVGAAEEFLSAKTIHDQIKSGKRETSSSSSTEAESDIFGNLSVEKEDPSEEVNGGIERGIDLNADQVDPPEVDVTSPVVSETKNSSQHVANSPATNQAAVPSGSASIRKRSSSPRTRPKIHELEQMLESQRAKLGRKHPDVAETLTAIAVLKSQDGETDVPVELLHEALNIRKSTGDRAAFARTLHKLGDVYARQKEYKSSLSCHTDALHLERLVYGYQHPEVAKTYNKVGSVYAGQGEFGTAISNHQHALQILKDCVGEDLNHPLVIQTLICIGAVYYKERNSLETIRAKTDGYSTFIEAGMLDVIAQAHEQRGSYRMAIAFFEEKLQLLRNEEKREMDKQEVSEALARLGTLSREAGLYLEALDYYDETATIQSALGRDQVAIAQGRLLKGTVLYYLGQYMGSLKLFKEAQTILQATVGDDQQVLIAETFQWIGLTQIELADYDSATNALDSALKIEEVALGNDHPTTLKTRLASATVLMHQAKFDTAIEQFTAILETQGRVHGPKHPNLAATMFNIGKTYEMKDDIVSAMKFYEESFFMAEKFLGHDHPSQATTLHCIADLQRKKKRYKKALQLLLSVLTMRKDTLGEGHVTVAMTLCSIGACHAATGRFAESAKVLDEALPIAERSVGDIHPAVGLIHVTKGNLFLRKCQFEQARTMIEKGIEIYIKCNTAKNHPLRVEAEGMVERVERDEALFV